MNILITNLSLFQKNPTEYSYSVRMNNCHIDSLKAYYTSSTIIELRRCIKSVQELIDTESVEYTVLKDSIIYSISINP